MNPEVNFFFEKKSIWQDEFNALRHIFLKSTLNEELKWGCPCYTFDKKNIALIHGFKEYCAILFHKGALLKDKSKLLIQQTVNVQSARQMRFANLNEIETQEKKIIAYIKEALAVEKSGLKIELKNTEEYSMPSEFKSAMKEIPALKKKFESLTPGRQRAYLLFFSSAKQSQTRKNRIDKQIPNILSGKGLND